MYVKLNRLTMEKIEKDNKKLPYEKPEISVIELGESPKLLSGSDGLMKKHHDQMD